MANPKFPYKPLIRALDVKAGTHYRPFGQAKLDYSVQDDYSPARRDIRQDGDTTVTTVTGQGRPTVETFTPVKQPEYTFCPKSDYGFIDTPIFGAWASDLPEASQTSLHETYDDDGTLKDNKFLRNTVDQKSFIRSYLPSLYTGGMRRMMQVVQGMGIDAVQKREDLWDKNDNYLRLQPGYITHGMYTNSGGKRWIIEVSNDGVFRIPVEFCTKLPADWQTAHSSAEGGGWPDAHKTLYKYWTPVEIKWARYTQIGPAPSFYTEGEAMLYDTCGWAFNSTGTSAVITGLKIDPDDPFEARLRAALYTLTIAENAEGKPSTATCVLTESAELVNRYNDTDENQGPAILQVADPYYVAQGLHGYCHTLPCYPGAIGPRTFATSTPVFAYYDESDALHVVRYTPSHDTSVSSGSTTESEALGAGTTYDQPTDGDVSVSESVWGPWQVTGYSTGATWGSYTTTRRWTPRFSSPAVSATGISEDSSKTDSTHEEYAQGVYQSMAFLGSAVIEIRRETTNRDTGETSVFMSRRTPAGDSTALVRGEGSLIATRARSYSEQVRRIQVLVLHGYDRTSYAVYTRETQAKTGITNSFGKTAYAVGHGGYEYTGEMGVGHEYPNWVAMAMSSFDVEYAVFTGTHWNDITETGTGISDLHTGYMVANASVNSGSAPAGYNEPDTNTSTLEGTVVVGSASYAMEIASDAAEQVYLDDAFFYKAGGNGAIDTRRAFYQVEINLSAAKVSGVGALTDVTGSIDAFVGYF